MTNQQRDAMGTRCLLASLAAPPAEEVPPDWAGGLGEVVQRIRLCLSLDDRLQAETVPAETLHQWRTDLDRSLVEMERTDRDLWFAWRQPGTWLDSLLRFRSIVSHVVGKAYWDDLAEVRYTDIDVERYLWGAR